MKEFILESYAAFTALLPLVLAVALTGGQKQKPLRLLMLAALGLYLAAVLNLTGAGTLYDCSLYGLQLRTEQINLLPFSQEIDKIAYLQNILLFMPLPLLWPQMGSARAILGSGWAFSLLLELSQLCNNRRTDVDDLLMNSLGALLGYAVARLLLTLLPNLAQREERPRWEPWLYLGAMFCGRFLLFNELGIARLLYGF